MSPIWITAGIVIIVLLVVVAVEKNTSRKLKRKYRKQETGNGGVGKCLKRVFMSA